MSHLFFIEIFIIWTPNPSLIFKKSENKIEYQLPYTIIVRRPMGFESNNPPPPSKEQKKPLSIKFWTFIIFFPGKFLQPGKKKRRRKVQKVL
jgi:hypothetical protein